VRIAGARGFSRWTLLVFAIIAPLMPAEMRAQELAGGAVAHRITGRVIAACGSLPLIVGARVLVAYWFSLPLDPAIFPRAAGLKPNTALSLVLLGYALYAQRPRAPHGMVVRGLTLGATLLVLAIAAATAVEYIAGVELGIDDLLARGVQSPRMSPITACALLCLSSVMVLSLHGVRVPVQLSQGLLGLTTLLTLLPIMGYLYGAPTLYAVAGRTAITPLAAMSLGLLAFGMFALRADEGLWPLLCGDNAGSALARRALPAVVLLPIAFGLVRLEAEAFGPVGLELGAALSAATTVLTFAALVLWSAHSLRLQHLARRAAAARLREARNTLELRVDERTHELQQSERELRDAAAELTIAKQRAEAAMRARADFLARMSHEMRTPLNGVVGMLEIAQREELTSAQRDRLQTAQASAETLLYLINDILEFSKLDARKLALEVAPFRLRDTLAAALRAAAMAAPEKHLELVLRAPREVPECLLGDARRLCQVVTNLVGNAIKFTARGQVELALQVVERTGTRVLLRAAVTDTGVGVPKDKQSQIFEAFTQADETTTRRFGGTGLGLAICTELVQLMDGTIGVESEPGQGASFFFTFALAVDEAAERERYRSALGGRRALLVEPHPGHRDFLGALLEEWGIESHDCAPLEAAPRLRDAARRGAGFSLLIVDTDAVAHLGESYFSRLRGVVGPLCPALQLTRTRFTRAARAGGVGLGSLELSKPVAPSALLEAIAGLLGTRSDPVQARPVTTAPAAPALKVLLAEDNEVNRRVAQFLLEEAGCQVTAVGDGAQALDALTAERFDVLLMDGHMPEMDGLEAVRILRERERQSGLYTPVIALTAQAMHGDRARYLAAGMDDYLSKPFTGSVLISTIRAVVERVARGARSATEAATQVGATETAPNATEAGPTASAAESVAKTAAAEAASRVNQAQGAPTVAAGEAAPAPEAANVAEGTARAVAMANVGTPAVPPVRSGPAADSVVALAAYARARLLDRVAGNETLLYQMVSVFSVEAPELVQAMRAALEAGDALRLERAAHKCVGACLTIGAEAAARTTRSLEIAARTGELTRAPELVEQVARELNELEQAFVAAGDLPRAQRSAPPSARMVR
jgi:signal transduction histidine kinase/CheY-like chemotaxis protein